MKHHASPQSNWVDRSEMILVEDLANRLSNNPHPLNLRFPDPIEYYFRHFYSQMSLGRQRLSLMLPMMWLFASGVVDLFVTQSSIADLWQFRLICLVILAGFFSLTYTVSFQYFRPLALFLYSMGISLTCLSLGVLTQAPYALVYYLSAGWMILFLVQTLQFTINWALILGACSLVTANIYWLGFGDLSTQTWLFLNFHFTFTLILGVISCYFKELEQRKAFLESEQTKLNRISREELESNRDRLPYIVALDALTGLANRKSFERTLSCEWKRSSRKRYPISLLEIHCHHITKTKDLLPKVFIEKHICEISQKIRGFARRSGDVSCRFEEDRFMVMLADTENHNAGIVAEKMLAAMVTLDWLEEDEAEDKNTDLHFSIGVATMTPNGHQSVRDLLNMAHQASTLASKREPNQFVCVNQLGSFPM